MTRALDLLAQGLAPYIERELKVIYGDTWVIAAQESFREDRGNFAHREDVLRRDAHSLLTIMWDQWNRVFRQNLGQPDRSLVSELRDFRNRWAHQEDFNFDDTYRILDSVQRILAAIDSTVAEIVADEKRQLLREEFSIEAEAAARKTEDTQKKWRDITIYVLCCGATVFAIMHSGFGTNGWILSGIVLLVFGYVAYQRVSTPARVYLGAHECVRCGKIIYQQPCPYCEAPARTPAVNVQDSVKA
ncbi:MAG: Swt1 family HEPN domain-containing protein [Planctomycetaceae bacterium]